MIDANKLKGIDGMEYVASAPKGETIITMVAFDGTLFVATDKDIYTLVDNKRLESTDFND